MLRQYTIGCNYFDAKFSNVLWFGLLTFYLACLKISQHMCVLIGKKPKPPVVMPSQSTTQI